MIHHFGSIHCSAMIEVPPKSPEAGRRERMAMEEAIRTDTSPRTGGVVDRTNAEHYLWGAGCDGWHLLSRQDLSVIQERMPIGSAEVRHYHRCARQVFFVLSGELEIELDGAHHRLATGQSLEIPPGVAHHTWNPGRLDAWFLVVSSPNTTGDREEVDRRDSTWPRDEEPLLETTRAASENRRRAGEAETGRLEI
jgi:mannose-6-phosphate isomerase-like protein (cupin superfamily)